ncbi:hypothetical protein [Hyphomicrobium sp.]|uniref:hypothetical protein n=1 Tax=Hyphomicrobium sp. TaxID=82 RepID=UPI002E31A880|nr:hypothetical protein [Hyphomicrobium sp.]HEX2840740.1 hypothetical protein [Hyphomicrobium sp.]
MPVVSVERVPVRMWSLGVLGFDHLQIVFQHEFSRLKPRQDEWFVIEGVRDVEGPHVRLGVEGWDGATTLSDANSGLANEALAERIGTSGSRGARVVAEHASALDLWATLTSFAADVHAQQFPYIPWTLPGSALPTINSSSLVASLLHHAGVDVDAALPSGLRFSPGTTTLLGTSRGDTLEADARFTTLVAGDGDDILAGGNEPSQIEKLYGGRGNDTLRWSLGFNILHGGQPGLAYDQDGTDAVDYTGAGPVTIEAPPQSVPHRTPDFIAGFKGGLDHLYSIEEITWNGTGDRVVIGRGVGLTSTPPKFKFSPANETTGGDGNVLDLSQAEVGFDVWSSASGDLRLVGRRDGGHAELAVSGLPRVVASPHADRFILVEAGSSLTVEDASKDDRIIVPWTPSRIVTSYDTATREAVLRLYADEAETPPAEISIRRFEPGDLALDLSQPFRLEPDGEHDSVLVSWASPVAGDGPWAFGDALAVDALGFGNPMGGFFMPSVADLGAVVLPGFE